MTDRSTYGRWLRRALYFFPFQLLMLHLKKSHGLLVLWLLLFGFVTQSIGSKYGVTYLFL